MDNLINAALDNKWGALNIDDQLQTPSGASHFTITETDEEIVKITTKGGNPIVIGRDAFLKAIKYLIVNRHIDQGTHCQIRSNKRYQDAGPLCQAVRSVNGTMTITYVLPMLRAMGLVEITQIGGLDSTWLI